MPISFAAVAMNDTTTERDKMQEMNRSLTMLVYGAAKAGKSTLAITTPAPRLYMDVEAASRFLPIEPVFWDPSKSAPPEADGTWDTAIVQTKDWRTVELAHQWLESGQHPFKSFIIDSISELQQRYIEDVAGRSQLTQQAWGDAFRAVGGLVRDIRDLTVHPTKPLEAVVLTAMAREFDGHWKPYLQGQLATIMPYLLDITAYLYAESVTNELTFEVTEVRRLLTRRTNQFEAGERVGGKVPAIVEDPNVSAMIDMIFGQKEETEE